MIKNRILGTLRFCRMPAMRLRVTSKQESLTPKHQRNRGSGSNPGVSSSNSSQIGYLLTTVNCACGLTTFCETRSVILAITV